MRWKKVAALLIFAVPVLLFVVMLAAERVGQASDQKEEARQKAVMEKVKVVTQAAQQYAAAHQGTLTRCEELGKGVRKTSALRLYL